MEINYHAGGGPPVAWRLGEQEDAHGGEERGHDELAEVARPALGVGEVHHLCSAGREEEPSSSIVARTKERKASAGPPDLRRTKIWAAASAAACRGWWAASAAAAAAASAQGRRDENPAADPGRRVRRGVEWRRAATGHEGAALYSLCGRGGDGKLSPSFLW